MSAEVILIAIVFIRKFQYRNFSSSRYRWEFALIARRPFTFAGQLHAMQLCHVLDISMSERGNRFYYLLSDEPARRSVRAAGAG
jgi:hypothetical protein